MPAVAGARQALIDLLVARALRLAGIGEPERFIRASGLCTCTGCGRLYYDHPADTDEPWLNVLCDGQRVKL